MEGFERCRRFVETLEEDVATTITDFPGGRALFNADFPLVWDHNFLRVDEPKLRWPELSKLADELQGRAGLGHRKLYLPDEEWARTYGMRALREGWGVTPLIFMVRTNPGTKTAEAPATEVDYAEMRKLREKMSRRQDWGSDENAVQQVLDANRAWALAANGRYFGARVEGELIAACDLYTKGDVAQVEDVETLAEFRGRGYATAVVMAAISAAESEGASTIFLIADEHDWPKQLYERMGFEVAGRTWAFLKTGV